jgi:hypothetical protein
MNFAKSTIFATQILAECLVNGSAKIKFSRKHQKDESLMGQK